MITDVFLTEIAKAINSESNAVPAYIAFSSSVITPDPGDTSLPSEYDRSATSNSRATNEVTYTASRSGTSVSGSGEYINTIGLLDTSTGGNLLAEGLVPSVLHTSTYDLEVNWKVIVERK